MDAAASADGTNRAAATIARKMLLFVINVIIVIDYQLTLYL